MPRTAAPSGHKIGSGTPPDKERILITFEFVTKFFSERKKGDEEYLKGESASEKKRRLQREKTAQQFKPPRKGAGVKCFRWIPESTNGQLMRKRIPERDVDKIWDSYTQKEYNSRLRQWDLYEVSLGQGAEEEG